AAITLRLLRLGYTNQISRVPTGKIIMKTCICLLACGLVSSAAFADTPAHVTADIVLRNGKIATLNPKQPEATALAVWKERILLVGKDADVQPFAGPQTRVIDLAGRRVVPGFHDSHVHLLGGGMQLGQVDLKDAADEAEFGRRLREFDKKLPPGRW